MKEIIARSDKLLLFSLIALLLSGVVMIYSASGFYAAERFGNEYHFLKKHIFSLIIALPVSFIFFHLKLEKLQLLAIPLAVFSFLLLLAVLIGGFGVSAGGATRWVRIAGFTFQPAELAKLSLIIILAHFLSRKANVIHSLKEGYLPALLIAAAFILPTLLQPDFGSAMFLALLTVILLYLAGTKLRHLLVTALISTPFIYFLIFSTAYRRRRILAFLDPWADPQNSGFQIIQSFIAFQQGGFFGQGLGDSRQKLFFLPEAHTDFIFSVIAEEIGFLGVIFTLCFFVLLLLRGTRVASKLKNPFYSYLAYGLTASISLQAIINMGVATGCLPTKGLTLPFLSYGGTSLIITAMMSVILIKLSAYASLPQRESRGGKR